MGFHRLGTPGFHVSTGHLGSGTDGKRLNFNKTSSVHQEKVSSTMRANSGSQGTRVLRVIAGLPPPALYLTIRPVALEGEGSNCFSITQLVGQKRQ